MSITRGALVLCLMGCMSSAAVAAEHTRVTNPNALSVELLGRGLLWSVSYDRVLNDDLVAGFGFGTVSTKNSGADTTAKMIPAYVNYYFMREQGSIFATGGASIITNSGDVKNKQSSTSGLDFSSSPVLPTLGIGYENRGDSGYLFRFAVYGILGDKIVPWAGFTFGYAF